MKLRKILPLIAVLLLMLVAIPLMVVAASAEEAPTPSEGLAFSYKKSLSGYVVTGLGTCADTDLVIPSTYEGEPVVMIGMNAFKNQTQLTSVYIPDSITFAGHACFLGCTNLTSVRLSPNMPTINTYMFSQSGLTSVEIPEGVTYVAGSAFRASKLESVSFPTTLTSIGPNAFRACRSLTAVTLPDNVQSLAHATFNGCAQLKTVELSAGMKEIANYAFDNCRNLRTVVFKEGLESIGMYAFRTNIYLKTIELPDSVTTIGNAAFRECKYMANVKLSNNIQTVGNFAFYKIAIVDLVIPASIQSAGRNAFTGNSATLTNVYYGGDAAAWDLVSWDNNAANLKLANLYYYSANDPQAEGFWHYVDGVPTVWEVVEAPEEFTVTFDANGKGTAPVAQTVVDGATATNPGALTATGYTFGGWYTDAACTQAYDFATAVTGDITLYAKWTAVTYTVTFDANGKGTAPVAQTVAYGNKATAPAAPTADNYTFDGWYTDAACTAAYDFNTAVTGNVTLYAKWVLSGDLVIGGDPESGDVELPGIGI